MQTLRHLMIAIIEMNTFISPGFSIVFFNCANESFLSFLLPLIWVKEKNLATLWPVKRYSTLSEHE